MFAQSQGQDGYKVKSQSMILPGISTDEAEYYFDVSQPVSVTSCFVYVDYQDESKRDSIEIHRVGLGGSRLYFYQYNRTNPTARPGTDAYVQINSMAIYWNIISKNVDNFGRIRQEANPGLKVKVYGGRINNPVLGDFDVSSTTLTLVDNSVSYIYFDDIDNEFKASITEPNMYFVLGKVTTASGDITEILDYRASYTGGGIPTSITEVQRNALTGVRNGVQIYNTTAGKLQFYSTGAWYDVPVTGGENQVPRLTEIIEGKARWASIDEMLAGMDIGSDGASLAVKPSTVRNLMNIGSFVAGENIPAYKTVSLLQDGKLYQLKGDKINYGTSPGSKNILLYDGRVISIARVSGALNMYIGTIVNNQITFGLATQIVSDNYDDGRAFCETAPNKIILTYNSSNIINKAIGIDVSGTITVGTAVQIRNSGSYGNGGTHMIQGISNQGVAIVVYTSNGNGSTGFTTLILSISGVIITLGGSNQYVANYGYYYKQLTVFGDKFFITAGQNTQYDYSYILCGQVSGTTISSAGGYTFPVVSGSNREYNYGVYQRIYIDPNGIDCYLITDSSGYGVRQFIKFTISGVNLARGTGYALGDAVGNLIIIGRMIGHWTGSTIKWYDKSFNLMGTNPIGIPSNSCMIYISNNYCFVNNTISGYLYSITNELFFRIGFIGSPIAKDQEGMVNMFGSSLSVPSLNRGVRCYINYANGDILQDINTYGYELGMAIDTDKLLVKI